MNASFAELVATTNYSFLRGASHPADMVWRAALLGMSGIGIADRNSVAGVVRAHVAWREVRAQMPDFRLVVGARLVFADDTPDIVAYPTTRHGWGRLTRLLTLGNRRAVKGDCILYLEDLLEWCEEIQLIILRASASPREQNLDHAETRRREEEACLRQLKAKTPLLWFGATMPRGGDDARKLAELAGLSEAVGIPLIATNDALYATPDQRVLHDIVTCIREGVTIQSAGRRLLANAERHLKPPEEMARLFRGYPQAIAATQDFLSRIDFTLDDLKYEYPHEPVPPGWQPQDWLEHMVMAAAQQRFPDGLPASWRKTINEEFHLIRAKGYAYYFLTVHDIVRHARSLDPPILCQGRGSAANSVVCYLLGITPVDPVANKLLFTRFLSEERNEPPDIDVDFEHERREEVMQYIYNRYGRERAGIAATLIHYRPRSTIREVGKALGLTEDVTARLASTIWGSWGGDVPDARVTEAGFDPANPEIARLKTIVDQLLEFPRHLSQHVGGFVLTEGRLDELVPIHNAAMPDRTFIEWDKDDIDALGLMKVDVLALGMLTCIRKAFDMLNASSPLPLAGGAGEGPELVETSCRPTPNPSRKREGDFLTLSTIPTECPQVYAMLQKGDSIGTFQVESRAQINMLPRMKPKNLYDLVIQVAIVRPGPIQGGMVHPYLRRRNGEERVDYPSPAPPHNPVELRDVLEKTMGVPLFQEQAMKLAIVAAGFTPAQADGLRRAMATFRNVGTIHRYEEMMIEGMVARGYTRDFAERCFNQIKGFGEYGFPESHAQAFGWLAYVSSWLKCHHPAVFTCALLNSQPMGFYAPAQLVRDAQEHGVKVRGVDLNVSGWDNGIEIKSPSPLGERSGWGLRLGFRQIDGFRQAWGEAIETARASGPFTSIEDLARRAALPPAALRKLADADAFGSLGKGRRDALWEARRTPPDQLPLFAFADAAELGAEPDAQLPAMPLSEEVVADYQMLRLSLKAHPMQFLREGFTREGVLSCADTNAAPDGRRVACAGIVLIRQRPGKGNAVFITIEDETGVVNALLWARDMAKQRRAVMASRLMRIEGVIQRSKENVVHLMASRIVDCTDRLDHLSESHRADPQLSHADEVTRPQMPRAPSQRAPGRSAGHPRNVRILPKSRDFH
ncbi:MAG: error-prone DNA polymerase [Sphingomonadales bacterium]|jgi:error-prone DNA polymerase|nr:error-prone DNA polymerase [Sphingomonadales bacterium]MBK9004848.1 error-prone DNA polymerase [Sphingomonadales bacterium]MBK9267423.1 error-prone DNA polymerase [Sphingomonadales bacterium]MBP6433185.1 error-prone DNA polymerase [Sphingorhabdus sp.]